MLSQGEIPRQHCGLAIAAPSLIEPPFPQHGWTIVDAHTRLTHGTANMPVRKQNHLAGDFEFDELESGMTCRLTFEAQGYYTVAFEDIRLDRDLHLGNIYLKAVKT